MLEEMDSNIKKKIRDYLRLTGAAIFFWVYLPHIVIYILGGKRQIINSDLIRVQRQVNIRLPLSILLLYFLHNDCYYRNLFYHRIGPVYSLFISWWRPGYKTFIIPDSTKIGNGILISHPYSTVLNAESIGENFSCIHCTTLGKKGENLRPVIGDNVTLGCNVTIIGGVHIGNNVIVGAGSVVVKDVPNNCVIAGNPAKIIRYLNNNE